MKPLDLTELTYLMIMAKMKQNEAIIFKTSLVSLAIQGVFKC